MRMQIPALALAVLGIAGTSCVSRSAEVDPSPTAGAEVGERAATGVVTSSMAESYVRLVLAMAPHDADYVDAYYGPPEWKAEVEAANASLADIRSGAVALAGRLDAVGAAAAGGDELERLRHAYLTRQIQALIARVDMLRGARLAFDEESRALYDAVAPRHDAAHYERVLARLDAALPGEGAAAGPVAERYQRYRRQFVIPDSLVDTVFRTAVAECRARTTRYIQLPPDENFVIEYVTGVSWSGYNWYQGKHRSLIQVNRDLPIYIDRAVDLACHEGYPGHHVYNVLLERHLVRERGWPEFSVYALFSPQSLIAEGSANHGIRMAFPGSERVEYERATLFPLAGLDPAGAAGYYRIQEIIRELSYAGNDAARRYLDGEIDADAAVDWLTRYALMTPEAARQRIRFFDQYRSYVINYNLGQDLVREYVEREAGAGASDARRWAVFGELLRSPRLPSGLR